MKEKATLHHCCNCLGSQIHLQQELNAGETHQSIHQPGSSLLSEGQMNLKPNVIYSWEVTCCYIRRLGRVTTTANQALACEEVVRSMPALISVLFLLEALVASLRLKGGHIVS